MYDLRKLSILIILTFSAPFLTPAQGHEATVSSADVALEERLGAEIPQGILLRDETGKTVDLKDLADKPTIIAPVYYRCTHTCPLMLTGLAEALGKLQIVEPGRDYRVIAISFDDRDTPEIAREKKPNYLTAINRPFPAEAWSFLTGDSANIRKFTDAIGFRVQRTGEDFTHPIALVVLAPGGKIVRYLHGITFLPFNITMAVTEAAQGKIGSTAGRVLTYCFSYDPLKNSYAFNILKVVGTVVVLSLLLFFIYLMRAGRKTTR